MDQRAGRGKSPSLTLTPATPRSHSTQARPGPRRRCRGDRGRGTRAEWEEKWEEIRADLCAVQAVSPRLVSFRCRPSPSADNTQFEVRRVPRESEKAYDCVSCGSKPPPGGGCLCAPAHLLKCPPIQYPSTHLAHVGRVEAQASPRIREPMINGFVCVIQKRGIERTPTALEQYCWGLGRTKGKLKVSQVRAKVQHAEVRGKSCL